MSHSCQGTPSDVSTVGGSLRQEASDLDTYEAASAKPHAHSHQCHGPGRESRLNKRLPCGPVVRQVNELDQNPR
jgi:hypothetical protein